MFKGILSIAQNSQMRLLANCLGRADKQQEHRGYSWCIILLLTYAAGVWHTNCIWSSLKGFGAGFHSFVTQSHLVEVRWLNPQRTLNVLFAPDFAPSLISSRSYFFSEFPPGFPPLFSPLQWSWSPLQGRLPQDHLRESLV